MFRFFTPGRSLFLSGSKKKGTAVLIFFLLFVVTLYPVEVKKVVVRTFDDFQEGEFKGTSLDSRGRLFIGPEIKKIAGPGREYYLSLDTGANGDIYVGTGHNASVYRIKPGQPAEEVFASDFLDVYALCFTRSGDIYAGTSPNGRIYKIKSGKKISVKNGSDIYEIKGQDESPTALKEKDRKSVEIFNPDERFIWDIKEDKAGNIIAAVGGSGGVYAIDKSGSAAKIFTPEDSHIISLYITKDNSILAGSGDRGILYKIEKRKVKVLFDTPFDEIKGICEDKEGNIFFSAARGVDRDRTGSKSGGFEPFLKSRKKEEKKPPPEKSILYCLRTNGLVDRVWASKEEYIYSTAYDRKDDSVLIGTGNFGRVYRVKEDGTFSIVYESESAQVFKIAGKNNGFTVISNNTAAIAQIQERLNNTGSYFSEVFDLEIQSELGRLYWDASTQPVPAVTLSIRAGNSNIPDNTWSDWSAPFSRPENSTVAISGVRYFQVKAVLNASNTGQSPYLDHFRVYYMQANLPPKVERIGIYIVKAKPVRPPREKDDKKKEKKDDILLVRWQAKDPNGDKLKYDISLQKTGDSGWILFKENLTETKLELDAELFEDGKYLLKVEADDAFANPPALAKSHAKISTPFIIDSTAPVIENFTLQGGKANFTVKDQTSLIAKVLYSFDGELWYPLLPKDKINDSKTEEFSFDLSSHKQRRSSKAQGFIFIKVVDEFDNYKVFQNEIK